MDNGEMYKMIVEQMNNRMDRLEESLRHYFDNQTIVCKAHDTQLDKNTTKIAVIEDRQQQADNREKKRLTAIGIVVTIINGAMTFFMNKLKF